MYFLIITYFSSSIPIFREAFYSKDSDINDILILYKTGNVLRYIVDDRSETRL